MTGASTGSSKASDKPNLNSKWLGICQPPWMTVVKSSHRMCYKTGVRKSFTAIIHRETCLSVGFSDAGIFLWILRNLENTFLAEHLRPTTTALYTPDVLGAVRRFQIWKSEFCHSHQFCGNTNDGNDKGNRRNCSYQLYQKSSKLWHILRMCNIYATLTVSAPEQDHRHFLILKFSLLSALGKCFAV